MLLSLLLISLVAYSTEEYFVVFLVNAPCLDYTDCTKFLKTVAKHPSDWSKNGDVGHAWIYLKGPTILEGGHTGEWGELQPRYMEGVLHNCFLGAKNPVSYLWCSQIDGCFQRGNGGHNPTFAAKVPLTPTQYSSILAFIQAYPFHLYSLTGNQCCTFVRKIGELLNLQLEDQVTLKIPPTLTLHGKTYHLWQDPKYQYLTFSSPDRLELSLKQLVQEGKAENVSYPKSPKSPLRELIFFPQRFLRFYFL